MHNFTHVKAEHLGKTGLGFYADAMVEHDALIGQLLDKVDALGLTDDTIVIYTTDNGPMLCLWPDAGMTPFRGEKNTGFEGGFRVPCIVRWPGVVAPGRRSPASLPAKIGFRRFSRRPACRTSKRSC